MKIFPTACRRIFRTDLPHQTKCYSKGLRSPTQRPQSLQHAQLPQREKVIAHTKKRIALDDEDSEKAKTHVRNRSEILDPPDTGGMGNKAQALQVNQHNLILLQIIYELWSYPISIGRALLVGQNAGAELDHHH